MECKSLAIALALVGRFINFEQAKIASRVEEEFQIEIWGVVEGGHDMDRLNNAVTCSSVDAFMNAYMSHEELDKHFELWNSKNYTSGGESIAQSV
jgi:chaperone required for assembly of F1-ATPase